MYKVKVKKEDSHGEFNRVKLNIIEPLFPVSWEALVG